LIAIEQSIVGLLYTQSRDEKVRRWALNALARLGREPTCMEAIVNTLKKYSNEPQTSAAAIAAIYRLSRKASEILKKLSFDEQMVTLAALG
jgi:HEAT repeat protein